MESVGYTQKASVTIVAAAGRCRVAKFARFLLHRVGPEDCFYVAHIRFNEVQEMKPVFILDALSLEETCGVYPGINVML